MGEYSIRPAAVEELPRLPAIERASAVLFAPYGLHERFVAVVTPLRDLERGQAAGVLWVAVGSDGNQNRVAMRCDL